MISTVHYSNIPKELQEVDRWVLWQPKLLGNGKVKKVPVKLYPPRNPRSDWQLFPCSITDDNSFTDFDTVRAHRDEICHDDELGIGFRLGDGWCGVDLDHVISKGQVDPLAKNIIRKIGSYTELSPSNTGIRIIARGDISCRRHKFPFGAKVVEIYGEKNRYFTITGRHICGAIEDKGRVIQRIHDMLIVKYPPILADTPTLTPTRLGVSGIEDATMIRKMLADSAFRSLWDREREGDESQLDWTLCCKLAYYCNNDVVLMRRLFEQSPHFETKDVDQLKKWKRKSYSELTIEKTANSRQHFNWDCGDKISDIESYQLFTEGLS
jgi:putative DNA primase/helicase